MHYLMTEHLAQTMMEDRLRQAKRYRRGHRSRPRRRDNLHVLFTDPRSKSGPRDTRPPGRAHDRRK